MPYELKVVANTEALYRLAAERFVHYAQTAVQLRGRFTVALSGGSTPSGMYALLANDRAMCEAVPWGKSYFFWGDERHVGPDHADSNYRRARTQLLSKVPVPEANVQRVIGEQCDAEASAQEYERTLQEFFELSPANCRASIWCSSAWVMMGIRRPYSPGPRRCMRISAWWRRTGSASSMGIALRSPFRY